MMISTNIYISQETQEFLIKAAISQQISVEELASSILKESIEKKLEKINSNSENKIKFTPNPLRKMQPYDYLADPSEPAISPDDWDMNQDAEVNDL